MMYSSRMVREALREGTRQGNTLFPELHDPLWRSRIAGHPYASRLAEQVLRLAEEAQSLPLPPITFKVFMAYAREGVREQYDRLLTGRLHQLSVFTLAATLQGKERWIGVIEERLWELANLYVWELSAVISVDVGKYGEGRPEPRQLIGLLTAETAFQLAETLSLFGDQLDPFLVYRLKRELEQRVFEPYRNFVYWWQTSSTNWQSVCSASIGCAALYCLEDEDQLALLLSKVLAGLQSYLEGFDADGVTTEGLDYWTYGFSSYVFFSELLRERTAGRLNLLEDQERVKAIAGFPLHVMLSGDLVANFSDCEERSGIPGYLACRLRQRLGISYKTSEQLLLQLEAEAGAGEMPRWAYLSRELAWPMDDEPGAERIAAGQGMTFFRDAQWLVDKRLTEDGRFLAFAAKGGHNDESHNHNDLGHFILHVAGRNVMPDLGAPEYTRETFSDNRYELLATSSCGHAVPIINGSLQLQGRERRAHVDCCRDDGKRTLFKLQLEQAYDLPELHSLLRELDWHYAERTLHIKDSFMFSSLPGEVKETLMFRDEPRVSKPGQMEVDAGVCKLSVSYPVSAVVHITPKSYITRKGGQASVYIVTMDIPGQGLETEVEIGIRILMA